MMKGEGGREFGRASILSALSKGGVICYLFLRSMCQPQLEQLLQCADTFVAILPGVTFNNPVKTS